MMESWTWLKKIRVGRGPHPTFSLRKTMFSTQKKSLKKRCLWLFVYIVHLEWFQTHLLPKYIWQVSCGSKRNSKAFRYCASPLTALFGSTKRQSSAKIEDVRLPVRMYLPPTFFKGAKTIPIALWPLGLDFGRLGGMVNTTSFYPAAVVKQQNVWRYSWKFCWHPLP